MSCPYTIAEPPQKLLSFCKTVKDLKRPSINNSHLNVCIFRNVFCPPPQTQTRKQLALATSLENVACFSLVSPTDGKMFVDHGSDVEEEMTG